MPAAARQQTSFRPPESGWERICALWPREASSDCERRAKELRETLAQQQKRLQALQEPFKGLSKDQVAGLIRQAVKLRQENEQEKQERAQQIKERFKAKRERERSDRSRGR